METKKKSFLIRHYRQIIGYVCFAVFSAGFGWWRLGQIAPGLSSDELKTVTHNMSWRGWIHLPIYPLTHLGQWLVIKGWGMSTFGLRSVSVALAIIALLLILLVVRKWLNQKVAVLLIFIVLGSAWWLNLSRLATGAGELMFWLALLIGSSWRLRDHATKGAWLIWCISMAGLCYCPGGIWIMLAILIATLLNRDFLICLKHIKARYKVLGIFVYVAGLAPLFVIVLKYPSSMQKILGVDSGLNLTNVLSNLWHGFAVLFVQLPTVNPAYGISGWWIPRFTFATLTILGLWALFNRSNNTQLHNSFRWLVVIALIGGIAIAGLSSSASNGPLVLIPTVFIIAAGLEYLFNTWQKMFPVNPYVRSFGVILVLILVGWTTVMGSRLYFNTWAHTPNTAYAFSPQLEDARQTIKNNSIQNGCYFVYLANDRQWAAATSTLFGRFSRNIACKYPVIGQSPDSLSSANYDLFVSKNAWQAMTLPEQTLLLGYPHYPVVNYRSSDTLEYWVFRLNQKVDTINK